MNIGVQFLVPILPLYAMNSLGATESQIGYLLGLYSFAALLARPLAGHLYDSMNRKNTYIFSMIIFGLLFIMYPMVSTFIMLIILRILHGVFFSFTTTGAATNISDILSSDRRTEGIGYFGLTNTLAMALGPAIALWIISKQDFFVLFITGTLIVGGAYILSRFVKFPSVNLSKKSLTLKSMFEPRVFSVSLIILLFGVVLGSIFSFILLFSENELQLGGGQFFLLYATGVFVLRLSTTKILKTRGPIPIVITGFTIQFTGLILLSITQNLVLFLFSALLLGMANGAIMPTLQAMTMNMVNHQKRGVANATFFAAVDIGIGGGSIVLGWIVAITSLRTMFLITGILNILPLVLFLTFVIKDYHKKVSEISY